MTDKQIIIDNVDVSGCEHFRKDDPCKNTCHYFCTPCEWVQIQNCMYKYGKRKEQECERLKEGYSELTDIVSPYMDDFTGYNEELGGFDIVLCVKELMEQLNQLKAENDKYSLFIEKLCDYAGLECDSEEQAMRTVSDLASQMNKARWIIDRYKQTLTEIKEIVNESFDSCYTCNSETACKKCIRGNILNKISEVENDR